MGTIVNIGLYPKRPSKVGGTVKQEDQRIVPIDIEVSTPEDDLPTVYAGKSFVPGTEKLYVNGVLACTEDCILLQDDNGNGYALQCTGIMPGDDVHLYADIAE